MFGDGGGGGEWGRVVVSDALSDYAIGLAWGMMLRRNLHNAGLSKNANCGDRSSAAEKGFVCI